jgi:ParB family transcriptional regulator, chromosome partitioning protein
MQIETVEISEIIPYARNPRENEDAVAAVAASIKEFGWQQPIVVDSDKVVVAGHTRLLAARKLGLDRVPIKYANDLTPTQIKAYRLLDNKIAEKSEWIDELLRLELDDLGDFDFSSFEVQFNIENMIEGIDLPDLPTGEKEPYQQKSFILHDKQAEIVDQAIAFCRNNGHANDPDNENANGNALAYICTMFVASVRSING